VRDVINVLWTVGKQGTTSKGTTFVKNFSSSSSARRPFILLYFSRKVLKEL